MLCCVQVANLVYSLMQQQKIFRTMKCEMNCVSKSLLVALVQVVV